MTNAARPSMLFAVASLGALLQACAGDATPTDSLSPAARAASANGANGTTPTPATGAAAGTDGAAKAGPTGSTTAPDTKRETDKGDVDAVLPLPAKDQPGDVGGADAPVVVPAAKCATLAGVVTTDYRLALARTPDAPGLSYWMLQLEGGQSRTDVLKNIIRSAEFPAARATLNDELFVTNLYTEFLGRKPDNAGKAYWLDSLAKGKPRADLAIAIVDSDEFRSPALNRDHACFF